MEPNEGWSIITVPKYLSEEPNLHSSSEDQQGLPKSMVYYLPPVFQTVNYSI